MRAEYAKKPNAVDIYRVGNKTDIILRRDIRQEERFDEGNERPHCAWVCEEKQIRYDGAVTAAEVQDDFDGWWNYTPGRNEAGAGPTMEERMETVEAVLMEMIMGE